MSDRGSMIVPSIDGRPNCDLSCHNYEALMCDLEAAVEELLRLAEGKITPAIARLWVIDNWPSLYDRHIKSS